MEVPAVQIQKRRSLGRGGPWGAEGKVPSMGAGPCVSAGACHACCCAHQPCLDLWPTWLSSSPPGGCPHPTATSVVPVLVLAWAAARKVGQEGVRDWSSKRFHGNHAGGGGTRQPQEQPARKAAMGKSPFRGRQQSPLKVCVAAAPELLPGKARDKPSHPELCREPEADTIHSANLQG
ncbi:uncharacterized protein LOC104652133 isoform X1 [Saimiri boliviensis]|uniref:uncharacterized protein LOC104652133 isoform X1 n=1 Tax=Saimiri boliviensis TaxID=27679 RepID=UPI003D76F177